jgi:hypothetical protein
MVAMEPMAVPYAAHADRAAAVTGGVTSPESEGAKTANDMASAEASTTEAATHATTMTAATAMAAAASTTAHQHQQTAPCTQNGVTSIDRLREGCRGRKSKRKSARPIRRHRCFPLRSMQAKLSLWLAKRKPTCSR